MTGAFAVPFILVAGVLTAIGEGIDRLQGRGHRVRHVQRATQRADAQNEQDYRAARRAMNEAAGQSWRNQFE